MEAVVIVKSSFVGIGETYIEGWRVVLSAGTGRLVVVAWRLGAGVRLVRVRVTVSVVTVTVVAAGAAWAATLIVEFTGSAQQPGY